MESKIREECIVLPTLGRIYRRGKKLRTVFTARFAMMLVPRRVRLLQGEITVLRFDVHQLIDIGLTLKVQVQVNQDLLVRFIDTNKYYFVYL